MFIIANSATLRRLTIISNNDKKKQHWTEQLTQVVNDSLHFASITIQFRWVGIALERQEK